MCFNTGFCSIFLAQFIEVLQKMHLQGNNVKYIFTLTTSTIISIFQVLLKGVLDEALSALVDNAEKTFLTSLQSQVNNKLIRVEAPPRDLSPTSGITSLLALLKDMLSTANMSEGRESDMGKVNNCTDIYVQFGRRYVLIKK